MSLYKHRCYGCLCYNIVSEKMKTELIHCSIPWNYISQLDIVINSIES